MARLMTAAPHGCNHLESDHNQRTPLNGWTRLFGTSGARPRMGPGPPDLDLNHQWASLSRNARVVSWCGSWKTVSVGPYSARLPSANTWTVLAMARTRPSWWVTTTIVCPPRARSEMTDMTS